MAVERVAHFDPAIVREEFTHASRPNSVLAPSPRLEKIHPKLSATLAFRMLRNNVYELGGRIAGNGRKRPLKIADSC